MIDKEKAKYVNNRCNRLLKTDDIRLALYMEGVYDRIHHSGHVLNNQGTDYLELRNVTFICDNDYIINVSEYEDLADGKWYEENYEPLIVWQLENTVQKLIDDNDTRQAILQFYDPDKNEKARSNMICTMYVSLRFDVTPKMNSLTYTVHMRSSDVHEFISDLKWHKKVATAIIKVLSNKLKQDVWLNPIVWNADSLQCWDNDWIYLKE